MDSAQGRGPASRRADYAEFEVLDPPVNFSLNASDVGVGHGMGPQPFGIQVTRTRHMVGAWESRLEAAGPHWTAPNAVRQRSAANTTSASTESPAPIENASVGPKRSHMMPASTLAPKVIRPLTA